MDSNPRKDASVHSPATPDLEAIRLEMETAWKSGLLAWLESFLSPSKDHWKSQSDQPWLVELVQFEIELQRRFGKSPNLDDYQSRFPHIDPEVLGDLVVLPILPPIDSSSDLLPNRYSKTEIIGQGGIGQIWRVNDRHMNRDLAIKTANDRTRNRSVANQRLEREALLTGSLQHPGVPPVFDHGILADGSEYFAMKLVDGQTLSEILEIQSSNQENLPTLLGIFHQVAQTVAYAHSESVVHRDLKPQNIMVGKFGEVQVMDWGMGKRIKTDSVGLEENAKPLFAKETTTPSDLPSRETASMGFDSSQADPMKSMTKTGEVFGTPSYMAPEQAQGNIDAIGPPADVFGLGAILFEILTNSRLYDNVETSEILKMAARGDRGDAPKRLENSNTNTELIDLCKNMLETDPLKRIQDAGQVSTAITDYQDGVQSRLRKAEIDRKAAEVKAGEERKRRRTAIWLSSVIALTFAVGLGGVLWQLNKTVIAKKESDDYASLADKRFIDAKRTVDEYLTQVSDSQALLASTPGTEKLRRNLLEKAKSYYETFVTTKPDDPVLKDELAQAYLSLGTIIQQLGSESKSEPYFQDAIRLSQELIDSGQAQPETRKRIFKAHSLVMKNLIAIGKLDEAIEKAKVTLAFAEELAAETPEDLHSQCAVSRTKYNLGYFYLNLKDLDAAREYLASAVLDGEKTLAQFPQSATAKTHELWR